MRVINGMYLSNDVCLSKTKKMLFTYLCHKKTFWPRKFKSASQITEEELIIFAANVIFSYDDFRIFEQNRNFF